MNRARLLDVSAFNGTSLDYAAIAAAKIDGIYCRVSIGMTVDRSFAVHRAGASKWGLIWGGYGVHLPGGDPIAEAKTYANAVGGALGASELPHVSDCETAGAKIEHADEWCAYLDDALVRDGGLYSYRSFLAENGAKVARDHRVRRRWLWLADYESEEHVPPGWGPLRLWQCFGDVGVAAIARAFGPTGIRGANLDGTGIHVDRDLFEGDSQALVKWITSTSLTQFPPPQAWQSPLDASQALQRATLADTDPAPSPDGSSTA